MKWALLAAATCLCLFRLLSNNTFQTFVNPHPSVYYHSIPLISRDYAQRPLLRAENFDLPCLEAYFTRGEPCHLDSKPPIDIVWTWVNGSDPLFNSEKTKAELAYLMADRPTRPPKPLSEQRRYRDNDELRHSMRSVRHNFGAHTRNFYLLTSDFEPPQNSTSSSYLKSSEVHRLGQIPQWLDYQSSSWKDDHIQLSLLHHSQFFDSYDGPIFSAIPIESQFPNLPLSSQTFVYMNDDMYMAQPLTPADWYTPEYGLVLRMQPTLLVDFTLQVPDSEWKSLRKSNFLLSKRFGKRKRPYLTHLPKALSMPMLSELKRVWASDIQETRQQVFPMVAGEEGSFNLQFTMSHYIVERWREGLLFSWIVAKIGGDQDQWDLDAALKDLNVLQVEAGDTELTVRGYDRDTMIEGRMHDILKDGGHEQGATTYGFSNLDGYPYSRLGTYPRNSDWKHINSFSTMRSVCTLKYHECFGDAQTASQVFLNVAFDTPKCGDCLIHALVKASGKLGLSAFLPPPERVFRTDALEYEETFSDLPPPHLPLVKDWHNGDFSLKGVLHEWSLRSNQGINVRRWIMEMLMRYRFSLGETPSFFVAMTSNSQAKSTILKLRRQSTQPNPAALICLNDNLKNDNRDFFNILHGWQTELWSEPSKWEIDRETP